MQVPFPCKQYNLLPLTALSKLESLCITAAGPEWQEDEEGAHSQLAAHQFPGHLTSLTKLQVPLEVVHTMSSVSACVNLRDLRLQVARDLDRDEIELWGAHEWDGLAPLTHLTRLHVTIDLEKFDEAFAGAYYGLLKKLKGLRVVGAYRWSPGFLPVLQNLTHVTAISGGWMVPAGLSLDGLVCPHVRELDSAFMRVPFRVFPNLMSLTMLWVAADLLSEISCCCTSLQRLALSPRSSGSHIAMALGGTSSCVLAMKSLAKLQQLTHLELSPGNDARLMAFTGVRAALGAMKLRYLFVRGPLSLFALGTLQGVHGLDELCVRVTEPHLSFTVEGVRAWLVSLAVVPKVSLVLCSEEQHSLVEDARQWATQLELPLPALLTVTVQPGCT
jgi:hypothetical protein